MDEKRAPVVKIAFIGDANVGKTSLVFRISNDEFDDRWRHVIVCDFPSRRMTTSFGQEVKLQLWDTAGQERYMSLTRSFFRGSDFVVFAFDVTSSCSLNTGIPHWLEVAQETSSPAVYILVATKCDDVEHRTISTEEGQNFAIENRMMYFETSAKTGDGVGELCQVMAEGVGAVSDGRCRMQTNFAARSCRIGNVKLPSQNEAVTRKGESNYTKNLCC